RARGEPAGGARVGQDHVRAAPRALRGYHGRALRRRLPEPLAAALRGARRGAPAGHARGADRARALARARAGPEPDRPRAGGTRRRAPPRDTAGLLPPAHPHRDGQGAARGPRPPPPEAVRALAALGGRVEVVRLGLAGAVPSLARALVGDPRPLQVLLYARRRARARVAALAARADLVHAQLVRAATYLPAGPRPAAVVDLVDALSASFARRAARQRGLLGLIAAGEAARLLRYENELVR